MQSDWEKKEKLKLHPYLVLLILVFKPESILLDTLAKRAF